MPSRVGFVSARSAFVEAGAIYTDAGLGRLIDALAARAGAFTLALSVAPVRHPLHDHRLAVPERDLVPLPQLPGVTRGFHKAVPCARAIAEVERRSDAVIVQLPFAAPLALLRPKKPHVYHVCMDQRAYVRATATYHGVAKAAAIAAAESFDLLHRGLLRLPHARVVTHGDELLRHFGSARGRAVVSSSIREAEIGSATRRRAADAPFRVLFVGYLREEKGFDVLCEAFQALSQRLPSAELMIVGARESVDHGASAKIEQALAALSERCTVHFAGHKGFGPEFFQCYADADVLALPTRSEGTPRVLVEARAFGCPVVASRVGGVPTSVTDGEDGLLVPPRDPGALAEALHRVATDRPLRDRLVKGGYARARTLTVERFAEALLEETQVARRTRLD